MVFLFFTGTVVFIVSTAKYGIAMGKVRSYLKEHKHKLYEDYHLDPVSLMLGPGEVDWNFQKLVLNKKYVNFKDSDLVRLCDKAYKYALWAFSSFVLLFVTAILNGVVGS